MDGLQMLRHARERHVCGRAYKSIDQHQIGHVIRPRDRRVVDDEDELGHAKQPLERLGGAVERRVPCKHLPGLEDLMLRVEVVQRLLYVPVPGGRGAMVSTMQGGRGAVVSTMPGGCGAMVSTGMLRVQRGRLDARTRASPSPDERGNQHALKGIPHSPRTRASP
jgi:hypothetical protein